jgi:amino acid transporter
MLQRIQTVHFAITMLLFGSLFAGLDLLTFELQDSGKIRTIDIFGRTTYTQTNTEETLVSNESIPLFLVAIAMILLLFITLMAYKNMHRQLSLARISMLINAVLVFLFVIWSTYLFITAPADSSNFVQLGFYVFASTLPFTYFGYKGVLKDKMLLDSINRLR